MVSIGWDSRLQRRRGRPAGRPAATARRITIEELAAWAGTIPHEVLTNINTRVPRVYRGG